MPPNPFLRYALLQKKKPLLIQECKFSSNSYADYSHGTCSGTSGCLHSLSSSNMSPFCMYQSTLLTCKCMFLAGMIATRLVVLLLLQAAQEKKKNNNPRYSLNYIRNFGRYNTDRSSASQLYQGPSCEHYLPVPQPLRASIATLPPFVAVNQTHCLPMHRRSVPSTATYNS